MAVEPEKAPGLPHPHPTTSFWLGQARSSSYIGYNSAPNVVHQAEVCIIGGGISGVSTAYWLLTAPNPPKSVVLLEARELASGATGRNGGHCRPDTARGFPLYSKLFNKEQALKIIQSEVDNLALMRETIKKENIDCDWHDSLTVDVAMDKTWVRTMKEALNAYRQAGGTAASGTKWIDDAAEARRMTRVPTAQGACVFQAASCYPYKLVCGLLDIAVKKGLHIYTRAPATSMTQHPDGTTTIDTPKGAVIAHKVIHCQNAFVATLLPEFVGKITPYRGQACQIVPTLAYSGKDRLKYTTSFRYGEGERTDFDYLIQRPRDGAMILGGGRALTATENLIDQTDDSVLIPDLTRHLRSALPKVFDKWGKQMSGEGLMTTWTGIMAVTHDMVPYVGGVEDRPNHYINAGHCGHGMSRCLTTSKGIAAIVQGASYDSTGMPECFQPTFERLNKYGNETVKQQWIRGSTPLNAEVETYARNSAQ